MHLKEVYNNYPRVFNIKGKSSLGLGKERLLLLKEILGNSKQASTIYISSCIAVVLR